MRITGPGAVSFGDGRSISCVVPGPPDAGVSLEVGVKPGICTIYRDPYPADLPGALEMEYRREGDPDFEDEGGLFLELSPEGSSGDFPLPIGEPHEFRFRHSYFIPEAGIGFTTEWSPAHPVRTLEARPPGPGFTIAQDESGNGFLALTLTTGLGGSDSVHAQVWPTSDRGYAFQLDRFGELGFRGPLPVGPLLLGRHYSTRMRVEAGRTTLGLWSGTVLVLSGAGDVIVRNKAVNKDRPELGFVTGRVEVLWGSPEPLYRLREDEDPQEIEPSVRVQWWVLGAFGLRPATDPQEVLVASPVGGSEDTEAEVPPGEYVEVRLRAEYPISHADLKESYAGLVVDPPEAYQIVGRSGAVASLWLSRAFVATQPLPPVLQRLAGGQVLATMTVPQAAGDTAIEVAYEESPGTVILAGRSGDALSVLPGSKIVASCTAVFTLVRVTRDYFPSHLVDDPTSPLHGLFVAGEGFRGPTSTDSPVLTVQYPNVFAGVAGHATAVVTRRALAATDEFGRIVYGREVVFTHFLSLTLTAPPVAKDVFLSALSHLVVQTSGGRLSVGDITVAKSAFADESTFVVAVDISETTHVSAALRTPDIVFMPAAPRPAYQAVVKTVYASGERSGDPAQEDSIVLGGPPLISVVVGAPRLRLTVGAAKSVDLAWSGAAAPSAEEPITGYVTRLRDKTVEGEPPAPYIYATHEADVSGVTAELARWGGEVECGVRAFTALSSSVWSVAEATGPALPVPDILDLESTLRVSFTTPAGSATATVAWGTTTSPNISGYRVDASLGGRVVATVDVTGSPAVLTGLPYSTATRFQEVAFIVRPFFRDGDQEAVGAPISHVQATPLAPDPTAPPATQTVPSTTLTLVHRSGGGRAQSYTARSYTTPTGSEYTDVTTEVLTGGMIQVGISFGIDHANGESPELEYSVNAGLSWTALRFDARAGSTTVRSVVAVPFLTRHELVLVPGTRPPPQRNPGRELTFEVSVDTSVRVRARLTNGAGTTGWLEQTVTVVANQANVSGTLSSWSGAVAVTRDMSDLSVYRYLLSVSDSYAIVATSGGATYRVLGRRDGRGFVHPVGVWGGSTALSSAVNTPIPAAPNALPLVPGEVYAAVLGVNSMTVQARDSAGNPALPWGATSLSIRYTPAGGTAVVVASTGLARTATAAFRIDDLLFDTVYSVEVAGVNADGTGPYSPAETLQTGPLALPAAPSLSLAPDPDEGHDIVLVWTEVPAQYVITGYEAFCARTDGGAAYKQAPLESDATTHTFEDLALGSEYAFWVEAVNAAGRTRSNVVVLSIAGALVLPAKVAKPTFEAVRRQLRASWAEADDAETYTASVRSKVGSGAWTPWTETDVGVSREWAANGLPGHTYVLRVGATNAVGGQSDWSDESDEVTIDAFDNPAAPTVSVAARDNVMSVGWSADTEVDRHRALVLGRHSPGATGVALTVAEDDTAFRMAVEYGRTYQVGVVAVKHRDTLTETRTTIAFAAPFTVPKFASGDPTPEWRGPATPPTPSFSFTSSSLVQLRWTPTDTSLLTLYVFGAREQVIPILAGHTSVNVNIVEGSYQALLVAHNDFGSAAGPIIAFTNG